MTSDLEKIKERFTKDIFAVETTDIKILEAGQGYCRCAFDPARKHMNSNGVVHGGAVFTLADFAFAIASNGVSGANYVTRQADITFIRPSGDKKLIATAQSVKDGRRACLYRIDVTDEDGKEVAFMTVNGYNTV